MAFLKNNSNGAKNEVKRITSCYIFVNMQDTYMNTYYVHMLMLYRYLTIQYTLKHIWPKCFTSLKEDLHQYINGKFCIQQVSYWNISLKEVFCLLWLWQVQICVCYSSHLGQRTNVFNSSKEIFHYSTCKMKKLLFMS